MSEQLRSILFVDDDRFLLSGMERQLDDHDHWQMEFVNSGEAALEAMQESPFDVIVSDMRMPGMHGSELLQKVQDQYPNTVRIMLSGQSDQEKEFRSIDPIHLYLTKPSRIDQIESAIERGCQLFEHLSL